MSIGSFGGVLGSAAGVPQSQKGAESERAQAESASQQRGVEQQQKAENAAGIGQTEEDQEASDRDANGRRLWEKAAPLTPEDEQTNTQSKDVTGESGNSLDLTG